MQIYRLLLLSAFFCCLGLNPSLASTIDSLLQRYESYSESTPREEKLATLQAIGQQYEAQGDWQNVVFNAKRIISVNDGDTSRLTADTYYDMATAYYRLGMLADAEQSTQIAYAYFKSIDYTKGVYNCLIGLGITAQEKGLNDTALAYYSEAEALDSLSQADQSLLMSNIAVAYADMDDDLTALDYMFKALAIDKQITPVDSNALSLSYSNIAASYINLDQPNRGEVYLDSALLFANNSIREANTYQNFMHLYMNQQDVEQAFFYFKLYQNTQETLLQKNFEEQVREIESAYAKEKQYLLEKAEQNKQIKRFRTWLFVIVVGILVLLAVGLLLLLNNRKKLYKSNLDKVLLEQQLLRTQMNPHFTFNTLSNIYSLIQTQEVERSAKMLKRFSNLVRIMLENAAESYVSLSSELNAVTEYVKIQEMRFQKPIRLTIDHDFDLEGLRIPPMFIQPFVENAVEHGIRSISDPTIAIRLEQRPKTLLITITDNGIGLSEAKKTTKAKKSMSIDINTKRLEILGHQLRVKAYVKVEDAEPQGTQVSLSIPYKTVQHANTCY